MEIVLGGNLVQEEHPLALTDGLVELGTAIDIQEVDELSDTTAAVIIFSDRIDEALKIAQATRPKTVGNVPILALTSALHVHGPEEASTFDHFGAIPNDPKKLAHLIRTTVIERIAIDLEALDIDEIDRKKRTIRVKDSKVQFTQQEFNLMLKLMSAPGTVFSRETLRAISGSYAEDPKAMDVMILKVRRKISPLPLKIETVNSSGFALETGNSINLQTSAIKSIGALNFDTRRGRLFFGAQEITNTHLTPTEARILNCLFSNPKKTISRDRIMLEIYDDPDSRKNKIIDTYICKMKVKLGKYGETIENHRGQGFCFNPDVFQLAS